MKVLKNYRFPIILLISVMLGALVGIVWPNTASFFKPFGDIYLNLMFTIVVPLVFFTIASSVSKMVDLKRLGKILSRTFIVFFVLCVISAILMLISCLIVNPVGSATIAVGAEEIVETVSVGEKIVAALTVNDFSDLLSRSHMLPLIIFSLLFGVGVSLLGERGKKVSSLLNLISEAMMKVVKIIMYYAPIGLFAYFVGLIEQFGTDIIGSYMRSFILYVVVALIYYVVFYTIYALIAGGKKGLKTFWKNIFTPTVTALATQSSLASLPTNLKATEDIGVPKDIREMSVSIGTTTNMHGSVMSAVLKIAFLFTLFGESFTGIGTLSVAVLIAILSGMVMSGIPGGGLIGEMLIVSLYSFPATAFPIIATIGIIIDAPATAINVTGNTISSMLITKYTEGKNWLKNSSIS